MQTHFADAPTNVASRTRDVRAQRELTDLVKELDDEARKIEAEDVRMDAEQ